MNLPLAVKYWTSPNSAMKIVAHLESAEFVLAAEPVGSMASSGRGRGSKSDPVLYIEFRKNGKPIDPSPWWAKGQKRMQG